MEFDCVGPYFIAFDRGVPSIYFIDIRRTSSSNVIKICSMDALGPMDDVDFVHSYFDKQSEDTTYKRIYVIGASTVTKKVYLWEVESVKETLTCHFSRMDSLPLDSKILKISFTNDLCSKFAPYAPVGAHLFFTYTQDQKVQFWTCFKGSWKRSLELASGTENFWYQVTELSVGVDVGTNCILEADPFGKIAIGITSLLVSAADE